MQGVSPAQQAGTQTDSCVEQPVQGSVTHRQTRTGGGGQQTLTGLQQTGLGSQHGLPANAVCESKRKLKARVVILIMEGLLLQKLWETSSTPPDRKQFPRQHNPPELPHVSGFQECPSRVLLSKCPHSLVSPDCEMANPRVMTNAARRRAAKQQGLAMGNCNWALQSDHDNLGQDNRT